MSKSFEQIRDEKLRHEILSVLSQARRFSPSGGLSGDRLLAEVMVPLAEDMGFEDDSHVIALCRDLVGAGLIEQKDKGTRRVNETLKPKHLSYQITFLGTQLLEEKIPPVAGIADERAV